MKEAAKRKLREKDGLLIKEEAPEVRAIARLCDLMDAIEYGNKLGILEYTIGGSTYDDILWLLNKTRIGDGLETYTAIPVINNVLIKRGRNH